MTALLCACLWFGPSQPMTASWYGLPFHGRTCADGSTFDMGGYTAAHRTLPFGTVLLVARGDRALLVTITDRGPFIAGRDLDLSRQAAKRLAMIPAGVAPVQTWRV